MCTHDKLINKDDQFYVPLFAWTMDAPNSFYWASLTLIVLKHPHSYNVAINVSKQSLLTRYSPFYDYKVMLLIYHHKRILAH